MKAFASVAEWTCDFAFHVCDPTISYGGVCRLAPRVVWEEQNQQTAQA